MICCNTNGLWYILKIKIYDPWNCQSFCITTTMHLAFSTTMPIRNCRHVIYVTVILARTSFCHRQNKPRQSSTADKWMVRVNEMDQLITLPTWLLIIFKKLENCLLALIYFHRLTRWIGHTSSCQWKGLNCEHQNKCTKYFKFNSATAARWTGAVHRLDAVV